ncbi:hydrogenase maturation nickel metallochaperone HypA [Marichromatium bheemlicum]|uniref:Hydrogenase maturation factor HypA n=1 Tax=Marichromatium bheemlicum TaxID=365339 RepID=A0ABX1I5Q0_9GAMM|nr:hydrogenase maturation nickel metallochaperone HypA [Marichromatium bheemlicum]NKN32908.1 hydrogenase maturation nickel metallochaperone HypA [Marichromatium bheemlicum]
MHELSVCQALLDQVERIADEHGATRVERILLRIGPLSGVEPSLLEHAYPLAAAGTRAEHAILAIEPAPVRVHCLDCGAESAAVPNRLLCGRCAGYRTRLVSGDEMLLANLELTIPDEPLSSADSD